MRWLSLPPLWLLVFARLLSSQSVPASQPLPGPQRLRERAIVRMKKSEKDLEKYSCIVHRQVLELNSDGSVKRQRAMEVQRFFVNGVEINHTLKRDGRELTGDEAKREQERVDKEVKKYSDVRAVNKTEAKGEKEADMLLRALVFYNAHRELRDGRSVVVYDLAGDPNFHPKKLEERFVQAVSGRIWLDEESGTPIELSVETKRDVKIAGGLLASVHKGSQLHLIQQRQPDGVWIMKAMAGSGDARAALFLHPRFRFKEELDKCQLFSVETHETIANPAKP